MKKWAGQLPTAAAMRCMLRAPVSPAAAGRQWLPDVGSPGYDCFTPLAPHQIEFSNNVTVALGGLLCSGTLNDDK
ncbi:hypothetical protein NI420_002324 [Salmonella enterica]|nr:hypothetical protein [Salmonella enterica]EJJ4247329.1 hypothetical protein [Salmonella enterica]